MLLPDQSFGSASHGPTEIEPPWFLPMCFKISAHLGRFKGPKGNPSMFYWLHWCYSRPPAQFQGTNSERTSYKRLALTRPTRATRALARSLDHLLAWSNQEVPPTLGQSVWCTLSTWNPPVICVSLLWVPLFGSPSIKKTKGQLPFVSGGKGPDKKKKTNPYTTCFKTRPGKRPT